METRESSPQPPRTALLVGLVLTATFGALAVVQPRRPVENAEAAALGIAARRTALGDKAGAIAALLACANRDPRACRCAYEAESLAVDIGHYDDAYAAMAAAPEACTATARGKGARAEALVAHNQIDEGLKEAAAALALDPYDVHATYATAWARSTVDSSPATIAVAERAVIGGRGVPAILVLGLLKYRTNDIVGARPLFEHAAALDPKDPHAAYDVALVAHQQGRYRDAREGYLHTLALDPAYRDARVNLVYLTHGAGAEEEAKHHLNALAAVAPGDDRIPALRALLGVQ